MNKIKGDEMRKLFVIVAVLVSVIFTQSNAFASDFSTITKNEKVVSALNVLEKIGAHDVIAILKGQNTTNRPVRVIFRDLAVYGLSKCEAVTMRTQSGGVVIYINKKHIDAPSEAVACLIAHESQHTDLSGTKAEEIRAWVKETVTWNAVVRQNQDIVYSNSPLVKRENYINRLYVAGNNGPEKISNLIATNPVYANLR